MLFEITDINLLIRYVIKGISAALKNIITFGFGKGNSCSDQTYRDSQY